MHCSQSRRAPFVPCLQKPQAQSPYYPDREVAQKEKIQDSAKETQWKEVVSYAEERSRTIETNLKKINVI